MRTWHCEGCGEYWYYYLERCPRCKGKLSDRISKKPQIIGLTEVHVPSIAHPIVPYKVLLLEDEHGVRFVKKTMKEHNIGDIFYHCDDALVNIIRCKYDLFLSVCEALDKYESELSNRSILINPITLSKMRYSEILGDYLMLLETVINILSSKGSRISIVEKVLDERMKRYLAKLPDHVERIGLDGQGSKLEPKRYDTLLNIPLISIPKEGFRGALYNMLKLVPDAVVLSKDALYKMQSYCKGFGSVITLVEARAAVIQKGAVAHVANPQLLISSLDPVAADAVACELFGEKAPAYIDNAKDAVLGEADIKDITLNDCLDNFRYTSENDEYRQMKGLHASGIIDAFVDEHNQGWDHGQWLALLESVKRRGIGLTDEKIGRLLEDRKRKISGDP